MKITGITIAKNDNYGGNLLERATLCLKSMSYSYDEIIYVDWGSPNNNSLFNLIKNNLEKNNKIRHIPISEEFIQSINLPSDSQLVVEVLARNIGIRRASHELIICNNIDIIVPKKINLDIEDNVFYTIARRDISLEEIWKIEREGHDIFEYLEDNYKSFIPHGYSGINNKDVWSKIDCCGDFQMAKKNIWFTIKGFEESMTGRGFADTNIQRKAINLGYEVRPIFDIPIFHINHQGGFGHCGYINDATKFVFEFNNGSFNSDTWGFSNVDFKEEVW